MAEDEGIALKNKKTTVLFIAGSGRSGSTLLNKILGQVDDFFSVGELRYIWERSLTEDRLCGCGVRFSQCSLWQAILERAFGREGVDTAKLLATQQQCTRVRHVPSVLFGAHGRSGIEWVEYRQQLTRLYAAISGVTGCRVVVDSSKISTFGYMLDTIESIDLYIVHLIRDPRAAAYSWLRSKPQPDGGPLDSMQQQSAVKSSVLWDIWNVTVVALWRHRSGRYLRLRYEDFVARPHEAVEQILAMVGHAGADTPFVNDETVVIGPNHSVAGNPNRLETGNVTLSADTEWLTRMRRWDRAVATGVTLPLLRCFGYQIWPGQNPWLPLALARRNR